MFDFFRDVALEVGGVDSQSVKLERNKKREEQKKNKIIFANDVKKVIYILAGLYILSSFGTISISLQLREYLYCIKTVVQVIVAVAIIVGLAIHTKKSEITTCILIAVFLFLQYASMLIQFNS